MSVIIKGMKLPQHAAVNGEKDTAYKCVILAHPDHSVELVVDASFASAYDNGHNIQRYPIAEIPTPHGRLIDDYKLLRALIKAFPNQSMNFYDTLERVIDEAPTIIEAEVSE